MSQKDFREEEVMGKAYDSRLMKRMLAYVKPYMGMVVIALLFLAATAIFALLRPYIIKLAIDNHIAPGVLEGFNRLILIFAGVLVGEFVFTYAQTYITRLLGQKIMYDLRMQIFSHIQSMSLKFFDRNPVGRLMTRVTSDVEALRELFSAGLVSMFGDIFKLVGIIGILLAFNWKLALVTFSALPLLVWATLWFKTNVREVYRRSRIAIAKINTFLQETITGMKIVQLYNREDQNRQDFEVRNRENLQAHLDSIFYYAVFFPLVEIINSLAIALIIWYGGGLVDRNMITFGALVAFIEYSQIFFRPIRDLSEKYNLLQAAMASSERIFKLIDTEPDVLPPDQPKSLTHVRGRIEFKDVWFAYDDENWILKGVSFVVEPGQKVAIVGATGAGKTTIISLVCRFYDIQKGEILIDGINIKEIDPRELRKYIGIVLQDAFLFSGNILENIRLWHTELTEDQVKAAATFVNAHLFIDKLEERYYAPVKERGDNISTGQKQLLAFARALVFDPTILILDEATSNIDTETEHIIQESLHRLMENRTSIVIAHRLSTIQDCDAILVMHKGQVCEQGNHDQLLRQRGIYYKLHQLQYTRKHHVENEITEITTVS